MAGSISLSLMIWSITCYFSRRHEAFGFTWGTTDLSVERNMAHIEVYVGNSISDCDRKGKFDWVDDKWISDRVVRLRFVASEPHPARDAFVVNCSKDMGQNRRHNCYMEKSWPSLARMEPRRWYVFTTDNNCLNMTNLVRYLNLMEKIYTPEEHLIMKSMNVEDLVYPLVNPYGTIIMSLAYFRLITTEHITHHELDPVLTVRLEGFAETLAATKIIGEMQKWTTPYIISGPGTVVGDCPSTVIHRTSDVISYVRWKNDVEYILPEDGWYFLQEGKVRMCRDYRNIGGTYSLLKMRQESHLVTESSLNKKDLEDLRHGKCENCKVMW